MRSLILALGLSLLSAAVWAEESIVDPSAYSVYLVHPFSSKLEIESASFEVHGKQGKLFSVPVANLFEKDRLHLKILSSGAQTLLFKSGEGDKEVSIQLGKAGFSAGWFKKIPVCREDSECEVLLRLNPHHRSIELRFLGVN